MTEKKTRKKKEPVDKICEACRTRYKEPVPDHACAWCKEEQAAKGRRAWVTSLQLGKVHLCDMEINEARELAALGIEKAVCK